VWVAFAGDEPAGFVLAFDTINFVRNKASCRIDLLYVEKKHRRKGMAKALVAAVARDALARKVVRLSVDAVETNKISNSLYRHSGFSARRDRAVKFSVEGNKLRQLLH
jgi:GNAT superfamily N-acetyltransferase